ncbi:MAG: hypothetical protein IIA85_02250 [Nanoarchaeota archaeon]|nr:hypothetical protein [Nanoarchaeota archaeon]
MRIVYYKRHEIDFFEIGSQICKEYFYLEDGNLLFYGVDGTKCIENVLFPSDENSELFNEARSLAKGIIPIGIIPSSNGVFFSDLREIDYDAPIWIEELLKDLNPINQSNS